MADRLVGPMAAAAAAGYSTTRMGVYRDLEYDTVLYLFACPPPQAPAMSRNLTRIFTIFCLAALLSFKFCIQWNIFCILSRRSSLAQSVTLCHHCIAIGRTDISTRLR